MGDESGVTAQVMEFGEKVREAKLTWSGHVQTVDRLDRTLELTGKRKRNH